MSGRSTSGAAADAGPAILVVDDNSAKRLAIEAVLQPLGHQIICVESGEAALAQVMRRTFAVILMDVQMPEMDGYETARFIRMREQSEHTPIIFVTAHVRDEAQIPIAYSSGAVDFIFAPIAPDVLRAKVSIFVDLFCKSAALETSLREVTLISDRLRDSEARTRAVLDNVADSIVTVGDDGTIASFNRAATALFGYLESEAIGQPFSIMVAPRFEGDRASHERVRQQLVNPDPGAGRSSEARGQRQDGSTFPMELDLSYVEQGTRTLHIGCLRDISERLAYTETLQHQALHDDLTGLPNRVLFGDRVQHALRAAAREGESLAVLVMDLDEFKNVNDTLGHQRGDALLRLVADRLAGCLRDGDTVARLGGDEFGILPLGPTDLAAAAIMAWTIAQALEAPFVVDGNRLDVRASIGIALAPEHGDNIDDLLRRADLAMYDAKRSGVGYALFAAEQEETPARRLALLGDLRRCVEQDELVLHYQPKIDLATRTTIGVEALLRWNHPSGRLVMPDEFLPEAERTALMMPITEWVLNEALRTLATWRDQGYELTMAVNLGAICLAEGSGLFAMVERLTSLWGIPPDKLTLELTESALIDTALPGLLARLQDMDARLSIDDFGTGYSSLLYLQQLPVVEIKADRSFVTTMASEQDDAVIVRSIIDLAHNLGLRVVAEGIEDEGTLDLLIEFGCDAAQGYFFSRPVPAADLVSWLDSSSFGLTRHQDDGSALRIAQVV
jgi:diguanylate cyclase (GGDEF)-like protein/PAS domain S-box-containing protein